LNTSTADDDFTPARNLADHGVAIDHDVLRGSGVQGYKAGLDRVARQVAANDQAAFDFLVAVEVADADPVVGGQQILHGHRGGKGGGGSKQGKGRQGGCGRFHGELRSIRNNIDGYGQQMLQGKGPAGFGYNDASSWLIQAMIRRRYSCQG
jgi:hypothetical protein